MADPPNEQYPSNQNAGYEQGLNQIRLDFADIGEQRLSELTSAGTNALNHFFEGTYGAPEKSTPDQKPTYWSYVRFLTWDVLRPKFGQGNTEYANHDFDEKFMQDITDAAHETASMLPENVSHREWLFLTRFWSHKILNDPELVEKGYVTEGGREKYLQNAQHMGQSDDRYHHEFAFWTDQYEIGLRGERQKPELKDILEKQRHKSASPKEIVQKIVDSAVSMFEPEKFINPDRPELSSLSLQTMVELNGSKYHARITFHEIREVGVLLTTLQLVNTEKDNPNFAVVMGVSGNENVYGYANFTGIDLHEKIPEILSAIRQSDDERTDLDDIFFESMPKLESAYNNPDHIDESETNPDLDAILDAIEKVSQDPVSELRTMVNKLVSRDFMITRSEENPLDMKLYPLADGSELAITIARDEQYEPKIICINRIQTDQNGRLIRGVQFIVFNNYSSPSEQKYEIPNEPDDATKQAVIKQVISAKDQDPLVTQILSIIMISTGPPPQDYQGDIYDYYSQVIVTNEQFKELADVFVHVARQSNTYRVIDGSASFHPLELPEIIRMSQDVKTLVEV